MESKSSYKKIPGGKAVRIDIEYGNIIEKISITGDFFMYPENAINAVEEALNHLHVPVTKNDAVNAVKLALQATKASMIGVAPEDIGEMLEEMTS